MITKVNIRGTEHPMIYGYGALMLAEEILGQPWGGNQSAKTTIILLYACMLNGDDKFPYDFAEFVRLVDSEDGLLADLNRCLATQIERWGKPKAEAEEGKKKD